MKQTSIFDTHHSPQKHQWHLFIDGAARHNPGQAGAGVYLLKDNEPVIKKGFYLGIKTNNQAEYLALLLGLYFAKKQLSSDESVIIYSDSELLVKQMHGVYRVKNPELRVLFDCAHTYRPFFSFSLHHILRHKNTIADELANKGIDKKVSLPADFLSVCL
ncbi:MAG: ribonuclease HI family protein [Candidatus Babeliaceae bacterium]